MTNLIHRTFHNKRWILPSIGDNPLYQLDKDSFLMDILYALGIDSVDEAKYHLTQYSDSISLTEPSELPDLEVAVSRIAQAIKNNEKICVYGDYDVDGTTSVALLIRVLRLLGADCTYYIPNRFDEGYGLNSKAVVKIKSQRQATLLITCDCGITNHSEIALAQSLGLDVIVTDHHSVPPDKPPAIAVVNPKFLPDKHPLYWLPGVGVAYKLAESLCQERSDIDITKYLDLVALGMVADLAPLRGENRLLTKIGLHELARTNKVGLRALLKECGFNFDEESVGFQLAPRINAAGRLYSAEKAVELFLTEDEVEASHIAEDLSGQNAQRQELCESILQEAIQQAEIDNEHNVLMLLGEGWHHGVIGIVASKLVEKYHKPVFLATVESDGIVKGSARGIEAIDLHYEMSKFSSLFIKFGGHKAAAGFSMEMEQWLKFKAGMSENLDELLSEDDLQAKLSVHQMISPEDVSMELYNRIDSLAPYGMGFPRPVFVFDEVVKVIKVESLSQGKHTKITLRCGGQILESLQWNVSPTQIENILKGCRKIFPAFHLTKNNYRNVDKLQILIKDFWCQNLSAKQALKKIWKYIQSLQQSELHLDINQFALENIMTPAVCVEALRVVEQMGYISLREQANHQVKIIITGDIKTTQVDLKNLETLLSS